MKRNIGVICNDGLPSMQVSSTEPMTIEESMQKDAKSTFTIQNFTRDFIDLDRYNYPAGVKKKRKCNNAQRPKPRKKKK